MKAFLMIMVLGLASCGEKRDEAKVAFALNDVQLAAMQVAMKRTDADRRDATVADGVEYSEAIKALAASEAAAVAKLATEEEIRIRRQLGESQGKKSMADIKEQLRRIGIH